MSQLAARAAYLPDTHQSAPERLLSACSYCKIGANESSEASATPEDSTSMVKWSVGGSVDYEVIGPRQKSLDDDGTLVLATRRRTRSTGRLTQVNGTWYPGYIARSDSSTLYFKYEATKFKSYEEPIKKADRDDLARLRAGSGSGAPKKKPAARKPAKSPAKKKTVAKPAARKPSAKPAAKPAAKKPAAKKSHEPGVHGLVASIASREPPAQAREEKTSGQEESRQEEVARPQEKEVAA